MERTEPTLSSTELAFELFNDFYRRMGGRIDISDNIGCVRHLSGGYEIKLRRQDFTHSKVEATSPDGEIRFSFDDKGLLGANIYGRRGAWREFMDNAKKAQFRVLSIPLVLWTLNCILEDRLEPIPEGVTKAIDKLSKDGG